jgi:hypothetical protein
MGCSVRFANNPGRTKERRIERLTVNIAPRAAKPNKSPPSQPGGFEVRLDGVTRRRESVGSPFLV